MVYPHTYRTEHSETKTTSQDYGAYYARHISNKIAIQPPLLKIIQYVDSRRQSFLTDLEKIIAIKSVSGDLEYRDELQQMISFTEDWFFKRGFYHESFNIGYQELEGQKVRLPPIVLAAVGDDPHKKTICIYLHLDVKKPNLDKWNTDPWKVTVEGNDIYGCGVAQGKTTLMHWFHVMEAFLSSNVDFPVNLKFIIESMYHHESLGLADFLPLRKHDFFVNIESLLVCDSEWIGEKHPCVIYGCVGIIHFELFIEKVPESKTHPKDDMVTIFKEIVDEDDHCLIPHFNDNVQQITPEEEKMYEAICEFSVEDIKDSLPPQRHSWDKTRLLMHYWRLCSIWVGETEECTCEKKDTTIFKRHFIEKIVPHQIVGRCVSATMAHIENVVKKHNIENKVTCEYLSGSRYWIENVSHPIYQAARRAAIQIYKEDPSMIREDRTRPLLNILESVLEKSILLLPLLSHGSDAGGDNENIRRRNFIESTKLLAAYLFQVAKS